MALAATLLPVASVGAHGRFPETNGILFDPSDPQRIVVRATYGLTVTEDGGATWEWVCQAVMGARLTEDPAIEIMSDGSLVVAVFDGVTRGTERGCTWQFPSADLTDRVVIDQDLHPSDPSSSFVVTSDGARPNLVYRTNDDGLTWTPTGPEIEPILFETIRVAPSDPDRIYLSGAYPPSGMMPRRPFVHRSTDGGATWMAFAFGDLREGDRNIFLLGVDPRDPAHVLMHVRSEDDDRMVRSRDGGETWSDVIAMPSLDGFVWSADGATAWVGGRMKSGLHRSTDGAGTFSQIGTLEIGCLELRGAELWACANNFTDGFSVGRSANDGDSFTPVMVFDDIRGVLTCDDGTTTRDTCDPMLPDLIFDLGLPLDAGVSRPDASVPPWLDAGPGSADAGDGGGMDASAADGGGLDEPGGKGCCSVAPGAGPEAPGVLSLTLLGAVMLRRRWRRAASR